MSKLQAALTKLRSVARPATSFADKLYLPAQQAQNDAFLPIDASAIENWLIAQNTANSAASRRSGNSYVTEAKTLLKTLQHTNRLIYTASERLQIMDVYKNPLKRVMQSLDSRYLYLDFPFESEAESAFQLATTLCQEMAFGYKFVVADSLAQQSATGKFSLVNDLMNDLVNEKANKARRCTAIKSANKYLTYLALRHSQIHRDWPDELWQDLNALMNIAMLDHSHKLVDQTSVDQPLTIEQQYTSLCALNILDQNQLTAEEVRSLFVKICRYANLMPLHKTAELAGKVSSIESTALLEKINDSCQEIYSTGIDGPPELHDLNGNQSENTRMHFSLHALLAKLYTDDHTHTVQRLSTGYKPGQSRVLQRTQRSTVITAETGLQDIHNRILLAPPSENVASQFTDLEHLLSTSSKDTNGNSLAPQRAMNQTDVLIQSDTQYCGCSFEVENESSGGFGLKWTGNGVCRVQVGELLAHCYQRTNFQDEDDNPEETSWHLSVIRWLRTDADGTLRLGVESLSQHTKAVSINRLINPQQSTQSMIEGLLINYQPIDSKAEMLILPKQNYKTGEKIVCHDDKNLQTIQLVEGVEISSSYQCFAIKKVEEEIVSESTTESDQYQLAV